MAKRYALKVLREYRPAAGIRSGRVYEGPYSHVEWPVAGKDKPGKWMHVKGKLKKCENGIHATSPKHLDEWFSHNDLTVWVIELGGKVEGSDYNTKLVARRGRIIARVPVPTPRGLYGPSRRMREKARELGREMIRKLEQADLNKHYRKQIIRKKVKRNV